MASLLLLRIRIQAYPSLLVYGLAGYSADWALLHWNSWGYEIWRRMRGALGGPPRFLIEIDFLESNHPPSDGIVLFREYVGDVEMVKDVIVVGELAGASVMALACGVY